jgi:hypothetical protein
VTSPQPFPRLELILFLFPSIKDNTTTMSTPLEPPKNELVPTRPAPKPKPLLCRQCESIRFRRLPTSNADPDSEIPLHPTRDSFLESLRLGCRLCILISSFLNLDEPDQLPRSETERDSDVAFISLRILTWATWYDFPDLYATHESIEALADPSPKFSTVESFATVLSKASRFDVVQFMAVTSKARITMPRSTRLEVRQGHVSGSWCFVTSLQVHWGAATNGL